MFCFVEKLFVMRVAVPTEKISASDAKMHVALLTLMSNQFSHECDLCSEHWLLVWSGMLAV